MRPKFIAVALLASSIALPAAAGQILLAPGAVVGDTGSYNYPATGHPGLFPAGRIFDQQTGPITAEVFAQGYWINGDNGHQSLLAITRPGRSPVSLPSSCTATPFTKVAR